MTLRWPDTLPMPQADAISIEGPQFHELIDVLTGPTRTRLAQRNVGGGHQFEVWLTAAQAEAFESWYSQVVKLHNGEWYAPWIGQSRVVAFADEYELRPLGRGWRLQGLAVQTRIDESLCDAHLTEVFGGVLRDEMPFSANIVKASLSATDIVKDDYPLYLIKSEPC